MSDQQFSANNFLQIWDMRTRRGEDLTGQFADVQKLILELRDLKNAYKQAVRAHPRGSAAAQKLADDYACNRTALSSEKKNTLLKNLEQVAVSLNSRIDSSTLTWGLHLGPVSKGKSTYRIALSNPETYYLARQLEQNLRVALEVRTVSRNQLAEQLQKTLGDSTDKYLMRSDIKSFYESVPHDRLLELLRDNARVSRTTVSFVRSLLNEYQTLTGSDLGLPRGIGASSLLAEAYLAQFDAQVRKLPGLIAHLRYVDDFVLIFAEGAHHPTVEQRKQTVRKAVRDLGLALNPTKTVHHTLRDERGTPLTRIRFLGYEYTITGHEVTVDMTQQRLERYKRKLDLAIASYRAQSSAPRAQSALVDRIEFLTSNTRLENNKQHALVGIYFSNPIITSTDGRIARLDRYLSRLLAQISMADATRSRIATFTFSTGFVLKRYRVFSSKRLGVIAKVWKDA